MNDLVLIVGGTSGIGLETANYLLNKDYVSCGEVSFKFFGISLAGLNIIVSSFLLILSIAGFRKLGN